MLTPLPAPPPPPWVRTVRHDELRDRADLRRAQRTTLRRPL